MSSKMGVWEWNSWLLLILCELIREAEHIHTYHVNLSIFTSIPDLWGIPTIPIHRLDEKPAARGILSDLTCDSDGKMDKFIGGESSLALHEVRGGGAYYLGMFLGGAYEEALGGVHNLFGGPSVVRVVQCDGPQAFAVTSAHAGPSCGDVLLVMRHEPEVMLETLKRLEEEEVVDAMACSFNSMPCHPPAAASPVVTMTLRMTTSPIALLIS